MTDSDAPVLPNSSGLSAFLDAQLAAVRSNMVGSEDRNLGHNIDAIYATMREVIAAVATLEARLPS